MVARGGNPLLYWKKFNGLKMTDEGITKFV